jgi:hypothetical protein
MGDWQPTPEMLFALAREASSGSLPMVGEEPTMDGNAVAEQLGARVEAATAFAIGTGEQILLKATEVVKELTACTSPDLTKYLSQQVQRGELRRVLEQFFSPVREHPAILWTHSTCWSDRCFALANGATVRGYPQPNKAVNGNGRVSLGFENFRSRVRGPGGTKNYVVMVPSRLDWLLPPGLSLGRFLRYHEDSYVIRGKRSVSMVHRERLGAGTLSAEHGRFFDIGQFPAIDGKVHGIWRHPDTGLPIVTPSEFLIRNRDSPLFPIKTIDESGIFDVHIFKVHRYFIREHDCERKEFVFDELTFNFNRNGDPPRIVWIGAQQDVFDWSDMDWFSKTGQGRLITRLSKAWRESPR